MAKRHEYPSPVTAERIQKVFDDNNLTDTEVAKDFEVQRKTIWAYRNCVYSPSVSFIRGFCAKYNVTADWILGLE